VSATAPSRAIVDLNAFAHNLGVIKRMIPATCRLAPVLKADAYGHGAMPLARRAFEEGASIVGVASVDEGIELREAGIEGPVLVTVQPRRMAVEAAVEFDLAVMVSDIATAEALNAAARGAGKIVKVHAKVDTGMGRQGFDYETSSSTLLYLTRLSNVDIEGLATHFPVADSARDAYTAQQLKRFRHLLHACERAGLPYEVAHCANSAALVNYPASALDMVRPGLMCYGVWPTDEPPDPSPLRRVMTWETDIVLIRDLPESVSIGYDRTYMTDAPMRAALLPVGYADGYPLALSNKAAVLIRGRRCPVRGRVSMDQTVVDVTHVPEACVGDTATLIGSDGGEAIGAEHLALLAGTIPYEILTGIGRRVRRIYVE
jgi:alanine racemase